MSLLQLMVLGSIRIANYLSIPISFKRHYSNGGEEGGTDNARKNEEKVRQNDQTMEQVGLFYFL